MEHQTLNQILSSLHTATPGAIQLLEELFTPVFFRKGMILNTPDHSFPVLYFIETGLLRGYCVYHQEEYTCWIMQSGFLLPTLGFFTQKPGLEYVQFLADSSGWSLNLDGAEILAKKEPLIYRILLEIYETEIHEGKERELMLRLPQAEDRYLMEEEKNPNLIYKVVNDIASSYLNTGTKHLFKIKKRKRK